MDNNKIGDIISVKKIMILKKLILIFVNNILDNINTPIEWESIDFFVNKDKESLTFNEVNCNLDNSFFDIEANRIDLVNILFRWILSEENDG